MQHRHLNYHGFTTAAVDDIIRRGGWRDWVDLRQALHSDPEIEARIRRVCDQPGSAPPVENWQRLAFWRKYVERFAARVG